MKTCYECKGQVKETKVKKEGVGIICLKCTQCGEEYFTSSELIKFDILTGRRKKVRKIGVLGDSPIVRIPSQILKKTNLKIGDHLIFEIKKEGILMKKVIF